MVIRCSCTDEERDINDGDVNRHLTYACVKTPVAPPSGHGFASSAAPGYGYGAAHYSRPRPRHQRRHPTSEYLAEIYIRRFDEKYTEDEIKRLVQNITGLEKSFTKVEVEKKAPSKDTPGGEALVRFSSSEEAFEAARRLNKANWEGREIMVHLVGTGKTLVKPPPLSPTHGPSSIA